MNPRIKKRLITALALVISAGVAIPIFWSPVNRVVAEFDESLFGDEPDLPSFAKQNIDKAEFMTQRSENIAKLRGLSDEEANPAMRMEAIRKLESQQKEIARNRPEGVVAPTWTAIGPKPIPNAQVISGPSTPSSGRATAIAVHPANPDIVYVGTAQGGLYRSTNGGNNWTPLMDGALSLAIGAIAIAPSQPDTLYVGTGEPQFSGDSFFGVGIYRITNASGAAPVINGPFHDGPANADVFSGRSVGEIAVHPTDPNTIFVATTSGIGGLGGIATNQLPSRGIYRSTNALSATPTFSKLNGLIAGANRNVRDIELDPLNPNLLVANVVFAVNPASSDSGIYVSTDALSAEPTFTQRVVFTNTSTSELTAEFAIHHTVGPNPTIYAATGNLGGRVLMSTDGGTNWNQQIDNNFCSPQCFYDIAIDVDPTNANNVFLGGAPTLAFGRSTNGGTSFTTNGATARGLHADSHVIAVSQSLPTTIYFGSDGGIYKSTDSGTTWTSLNNSDFSATQFMSIDVHPTDPNFTIGGTQDNGTNFYAPDGSWRRSDFGDGGYAVIDQNAADTTNVRMYHTYFNNGSLQGYATVSSTNQASEGNWTFSGCQSAGATSNGITCNGTVLFYAPLQRGPGNPNTIYFGSDRLYRSADSGGTNVVVSQNPITAGVAISAIGISPQDDNIRVVGLENGGLFGTTTGATTLVNLDPTNTVPNAFVGSFVVDPQNANVAYLTLNGFGLSGNVWKTNNLTSSPPTWLSASTGLPAVPVNALVIDQRNSNDVYVGTDIGVYVSHNAGAAWAPFGDGLPRVAVFGIAIAPGNPRKLRIATHGKGMFEIAIETKRGTPFDYDGDGESDFSVWRPSDGTWHLVLSGSGGYRPQQWGLPGDKIVPADFDGDGMTDMAVYRPNDNGSGLGRWYVINSSNFSFNDFQFGVSGDVPLPQDYDGDGRADLCVFRPADSTWYLVKSTNNLFYVYPFGIAGDKPVPADYSGDGKAEIAVWRPADGSWHTVNLTDGSYRTFNWGLPGDVPVPGDYSGDGRADYSVYRPANNTWYRMNSNDFFMYDTRWGVAGDIPVPGDYDGDGSLDLAVFRPVEGRWYVLTASFAFMTQQFGINGDKPTESAFVYATSNF